jgi:hypothetical protein
MKVKVQNSVIKTLIGCLTQMEMRHVKLPVKMWYSLSYTKNKLESADKVTEAARIKLVEKYGEKDEKGIITIPQDSENYEPFMKEYADLLEMVVEVEVRKIKLSGLEDALKDMEGVQGIFRFFEVLVEDEEETPVTSEEPALETVE